MRTATFLRGTDDEFLKALGVPYGHIVIEGCDPVEVITLAGARTVLQEAVKRKFIEADAAALIEGAITGAGVFANTDNLFSVARKHPMPKDLGRVAQFDTACSETPKLAAAMPHGRIVSSTGKPVSQTITTLTAGFAACRILANYGLMRMFDLATLLRDMSAANLAMDDAEYKTRWEALSEDRRKEIIAEARVANVRRTAEMIEQHPLLAALFSAGHEE